MMETPPLATNGCSTSTEWRDHERWLRTLALARIGDRDVVDELLQNVAMAWVVARQRAVEIQQLGPWLYRVLIRQCLLYRRQQGRRRALQTRLQQALPADGSAQVATPDPLGWLMADERELQVQRALGELRVGDAQVLLLKYSEGWTYQQIADHLGVTVGTVESRLHRARCRLRQDLRRWQEDPY